MRDPIAIVAPAIDIAQLERAVSKANIVYEDATRNVEAAERKTESLRDKQAQARLELGYALVDLRKGCRHGEWKPALERQGITKQRASEMVRLVGFVEDEESKGPTFSDAGPLKAPTLRDAGIDKRPRKSDEQPDAEPAVDAGAAAWKDEIERRRTVAAPRRDDDAAIDKFLIGLAELRKSIQPAKLPQLIHETRELLKIFEQALKETK